MWGNLNSHYHGKEKGCDMSVKEFFRNRDDRNGGRLIGRYCKTHNKDTCRCGWEWHWHSGIFSNPGKTTI